MPNKATSVALPRGDLAGFLMETPAQQNFIADLILPPFSVPAKTGSFMRVPLEAMLSRKDVKRAAGAKYGRSDHEMEEDTYTCKERGHEHTLDDGEAAMYARQGNYDQVVSARLRQILMIEREVRVVALLHNTSTFPLSGSTGHNAAVEWDTEATCDPVYDVQTAINGIRARGGATNNPVLQVSYKAWYDLWRADAIKNNIRYVVGVELPDHTNAAARAAMARQLGVKDVIVGEAFYNSALQGAAPVIADAWSSEYAFVFNKPVGGDIQETALGRTFTYDEDGGLFTVEEYRDETTRSNVLRVRQNVDEKILNAACGYLIGNAHT